MRILFVCRAFVGLESTWRDYTWEPTGVPTIYKIIEALDARSEELRMIFTVRDEQGSTSDGSFPPYRAIEVAGLHSRILISAEPFRLPKFFRHFQTILTEFVQSIRILLQVWKMRPDVVYVDRANLIPGALVARFARVPVLLRLMGVPPSLWDIFNSRHPWLRIMRWAFRSPFAHVLCTQDGTPGKEFMNMALKPKVPRQVMLNGVDMNQLGAIPDLQLEKILNDKFVVLFIGRLVEIKGPETFVDAVLRLFPVGSDRIHALIVGTGKLEERLRAKVAKAGAEKMITFISSVPHRRILAIHQLADAYVSLNRMGNLSNANLECMYNGLCMIVPPSRPEEGTDVDLDRLMPSDTIIRLSPDSDEVLQLASLIEELSKNPTQVQERQKRTAAVAKEKIRSWEERISVEMKILRELSGSHLS